MLSSIAAASFRTGLSSAMTAANARHLATSVSARALACGTSRSALAASLKDTALSASTVRSRSAQAFGRESFAQGRPMATQSGPSATDFFGSQSISAKDQATIRKCLDGVHLTHIPVPGLSSTAGRALARAGAKLFFKEVVEQHPARSAFAGEEVVAASPAVANQKKGSDYLMWFNKGARQHPHYHPGDRYLTIFAPAGLQVLLGGSDPSVLARDKVPFVQVNIPPGIAMLTFAKRDVLHGFQGADEEGFGAISHHSDDLSEVQEKSASAGRGESSAASLGDKDLMSKLTGYVRPEQVDVVASIPASVVHDLAAQRR